MNKLKQNITIVPSSLLQGLKPYLLLEFFDYPYLTVDSSNTGSLFLNYYIDGKDDFYNHLITEISKERLNLFLAGDYQLRQIFDNPETNVIYHAQFNKKGVIDELGIIDFNIYNSLDLIPTNYDLDYDFEEENEIVDLKLKSIQRGKILVDVYLQASSLRSSLKYWALKSFFIPFSELVRTSLLNQSQNYTIQNLDKKVNLGINHFAISSLSSTIELNYNADLFGESKDLENIANLFLILNSQKEEDIIKSFDSFSNKKIIAEYLKILNVIIKNDAVLCTKVAAPNDYFSESYLTKKEAQEIKNIINEKLPNVEDIEEIQGYLLELSFDKTNPTFSMNASLEEFKYKGRIDEDLVQKISESEFTFLSKEYIFTIHTLYTPETSKSPEKITRTLKNIKEFAEE